MIPFLKALQQLPAIICAWLKSIIARLSVMFGRGIINSLSYTMISTYYYLPSHQCQSNSKWFLRCKNNSQIEVVVFLYRIFMYWHIKCTEFWKNFDSYRRISRSKRIMTFYHHYAMSSYSVGYLKYTQGICAICCAMIFDIPAIYTKHTCMIRMPLNSWFLKVLYVITIY